MILKDEKKLMQQRREVLLPELESHRLKFLEKEYQPNQGLVGKCPQSDQ